MTFLISLLLFACSSPEPVQSTPCCTVGEIVQLHKQGVSEGVLLDTLRTSHTLLALSAQDIGNLVKAGVPRAVIDRLNGGPCVCTNDPTTNIPVPATTIEANATMKLELHGSIRRTFQLVSPTGTTYTNVLLVLNGKYERRIAEIGPKKILIRISSFSNPKTLASADGERLRSLSATSDQGTWNVEIGE